MQQRLVSLLAVAVAMLLTSGSMQGQSNDSVTVIITLKAQASSATRSELVATLGDSALAQGDPVAADHHRAMAVDRALSQIEARTSSDREALKNAVLNIGGIVVGTLRSQGVVIARVPRRAIPSLRLHPRVAAVDEDVRQKAALDVATATMRVDAFWNAGFTGGSTDVAVVDSGLYIGNDAFTARASSVFCAVFHASAVNDPLYDDNPLTCDDLQGHGTKVSGMVFSQGTSAFPLRKGTGYGIDLTSRGF